MKRSIVLFALLLLVSGVAQAKNPVVVDAGGTGDFTTIQAAISSWCAGAANAGETAPFTINVVPGTYIERLTLNSSIVWDVTKGFGGNIMGDIVIQSSVPGTRPVVKVGRSLGEDTGNNGLRILQDSYNVTLRDLLFCPAMASEIPGHNMPAAGAMIHVDQNATDAVFDTLLVENCLFTHTDLAGNPLVTSRTAAYTAGFVQPNAVGNIVTYFLYFYPDAGEPKHLTCNNCTFYGGTGGVVGNVTGVLARAHTTTAGDTITWHNCAFVQSGNYVTMLYGTAAGIFNITGTNQKAGPDNCTYIGTQWEVDNHALMISGALLQINVSNSIINLYGPEMATTTGTQGPRGAAGGTAQLVINDSILYNECTGGAKNGLAMIVNTKEAADADAFARCTFYSKPTMYYVVGTNSGTVPFRDCIFAGSGQVFPTAPVAGLTLDVDYCAYVEAGAHAIGGRGGAQTDGANVISGDPLFLGINALLANAFDVDAASFGGKGTAGSNLSGGADFIGSAVGSWDLY